MTKRLRFAATFVLSTAILAAAAPATISAARGTDSGCPTPKTYPVGTSGSTTDDLCHRRPY